MFRCVLLACCALALALSSGGAFEQRLSVLRSEARLGNSRGPQTLAGDWLLTMPAGHEFDAAIEADDRPNFYVFKPKMGGNNLAGVYELKDGNRLTLVTPRKVGMQGLVWEVKNSNTLILIEHPPSTQRGSDYTGSTLGRQKTVTPQRLR